jgi:glyoxylase-like metal-dependent hydrolase (beta-lactamase superfamily II)
MSKIKALINPVTPFQQNAPIIYCTETNKCAFVDPGGDIDILVESAKQNNLIPEKILLTHAHIDHAGGAHELARILNLKIEGPHTDDQFLIDTIEEQGQMMGIPAKKFVPDVWFNDGDKVDVGNLTLDIYLCPGHTPGHVIFVHKDSKFAIVGDVLFRGSIGRTDLPGGNHQDLLDSITTKLWPLGNDIEFVCGHGPGSTFGQERIDNAFVSDRALG